jgi:hypothetical protein
MEKKMKIYNISVLVCAFDEYEAIDKLDKGEWEDTNIISETETD